VRHPIYTGLIGMLVGTAVINGLGWWLLLPAAAVVLFGLKIRNEERLMRRTFGQQYDEYRRRVPQLVPGLRLGR
jgi:protein-S-isoprenylcysteine O-methyltransferase Ste14